jgi:predicted DNA-binding transcriptional regulator AlpA
MSQIKSTAPEQRGLSDRQAGALLGISWRSVRRLSESDPNFPQPFKLGRCTRWDREALERYIALLQQG